MIQYYLSQAENILVIETNYITLLFLNNVITYADKDQKTAILEHICDYQNGELLLKLCKLVCAVDLSLKNEACILMLHIISNSSLSSQLLILFYYIYYYYYYYYYYNINILIKSDLFNYNFMFGI